MRYNIENGEILIRINKQDYDQPSTVPVFDSLKNHGYSIGTSEIKVVDPVLKTHESRLHVIGDEASLEICRQILEGDEIGCLRDSFREGILPFEDYRGLTEIIVAEHLDDLLR